MVLRALPAESRADGGDAAVRDRKVARHARAAAAVEQSAAADQDVVHGLKATGKSGQFKRFHRACPARINREQGCMTGVLDMDAVPSVP